MDFSKLPFSTTYFIFFKFYLHNKQLFCFAVLEFPGLFVFTALIRVLVSASTQFCSSNVLLFYTLKLVYTYA